jgi:RimJ/RimL family protein N-acetyltransferase
MSIETEHLVLHLVTPAEAQRIVSQVPGPDDSWADGFPREDDLEGLGMLLRAGGDGTGDGTEAPPFGSMLITERASGNAIGSIGFYGPPDEEGQVTIGYGLVEQYRGRGLGTEALEGLVAYCRARPEVRTILADTDVDNKVSQRVLEKSGFTFIRASSELCFYRLAL